MRQASSRVYEAINGDPELLEYSVEEMARLERDVTARRRGVLGIQEPAVVNTRGRPSTRRKKSIYETIASRKLVGRK